MTNTFDLNERAILAMMQRLQTNLPTTIATINAARSANTTPPYTIDVPQLYLEAPPIAGQLSAFPVVAIAEGPTTFRDDVGWGATGVYELAIIAYLVDPDPRALAWKLRRYAQALATVALVGRNIDYGAWGTKLKSIQPGPRLRWPAGAQAPQQQLISWVAVLIEAYDEQNTP